MVLFSRVVQKYQVRKHLRLNPRIFLPLYLVVMAAVKSKTGSITPLKHDIEKKCTWYSQDTSLSSHLLKHSNDLPEPLSLLLLTQKGALSSPACRPSPPSPTPKPSPPLSPAQKPSPPPYAACMPSGFKSSMSHTDSLEFLRRMKNKQKSIKLSFESKEVSSRVKCTPHKNHHQSVNCCQVGEL